MDERKRLAIDIAGIANRFPYSPHEMSREQRFDAMWPYLQKKYLDCADAVLRATSNRE